jgi:hypothetical protein
MLQSARNTVLGREYDYGSINSMLNFQSEFDINLRGFYNL